jgi:hypothetical protein
VLVDRDVANGLEPSLKVRHTSPVLGCRRFCVVLNAGGLRIGEMAHFAQVTMALLPQGLGLAERHPFNVVHGEVDGAVHVSLPLLALVAVAAEAGAVL